MSTKHRSDPTGLATALPQALAERTRWLGDATPSSHGGYVLYWMRTALRAHENPALETAIALGRHLDLPVFVYQGLSERYPFASDRHHLFILEGARDVAAELGERGIGHAFHLEREGHRGPHLLTLARSAALVVTEDFPVAPLREWTTSLARKIDRPLVAVDTACIVPMRLVPWPFERAYEFRRSTAALRRERLVAELPSFEPVHPPFVPSLPFEPVDLASAELAGLVGQCQIGHGVAPVAHTRGGSTAGYLRWERFYDRGLRQYHRRRNDPLRHGVSRMSPYLHYGMVSPFRLAREAAAEGSAGAEKFLDELLVWRELAHAFCFHEPGYRTVAALPEWARQTLARHESDPRPQLPSWETLARARTNDALWNAAQTQLLRHGELHNNVRMTWGKALLSWTRDADEALEKLEDLNHRYALDGRDPASYGGILWCLGLFDRPFEPERPILGSVRSRSTASHGKRLDVERYHAEVSRSAVENPPRVLVIGGGVSGLACARTLSDAGFPVRVLDKGRGAGGRISTRRMDSLAFDHGAQYFTARDARFRQLVDSWREDGWVAPWQGRIGTLDNGRVGETEGSTERLVAVPGMSALARHLASDLVVQTGIRAETLERRGESWHVRCDDGSVQRAELVVLALPAPQARRLAPEESDFEQRLAAVQMAPCWALMAHFEEPVALALDGAFIDGSPLAWAARNSSKPGRPGGEQWVLHATPEWSLEHLEDESAAVEEALLAAFSHAVGSALPSLQTVVAHRWRHARATRALGEEYLFDTGLALGACGDWCPGERVEGAWLSGIALAGAILRRESTRRRAVDTATEELQLALPL